jgi:protein SCO1/2
MLFVTTDPRRDDPQALAAYLARYDPSYLGLTGPLRRILTVGHALGVPVEQGRRLPGGGYEVDHGTQVLGVLPDGSVPVVWTAGTTPAQLADDVRTVLRDGVPGTRARGAGR